MVWFWILVVLVALGALVGWLVFGRSRRAAGAGAVAGGCIGVKFLVWLAVTALSIMFVLWLFRVIF